MQVESALYSFVQMYEHSTLIAKAHKISVILYFFDRDMPLIHSLYLELLFWWTANGYAPFKLSIFYVLPKAVFLSMHG